MSLNIKNPEVYRLAQELAAIKGQSMTAVVLDALRKERLQVRSPTQKRADEDELLAIGKRCAAHIKQPVRAVDHGDILYDDSGMPH